jgi:hypothetical protein
MKIKQKNSIGIIRNPESEDIRYCPDCKNSAYKEYNRVYICANDDKMMQCIKCKHKHLKKDLIKESKYSNPKEISDNPNWKGVIGIHNKYTDPREKARQKLQEKISNETEADIIHAYKTGKTVTELGEWELPPETKITYDINPYSTYDHKSELRRMDTIEEQLGDYEG